MLAVSPNVPVAFRFRRHQRPLAWLSLLLVCLQLFASGVASVHAAKRFAVESLYTAAVCHGSGVDGANAADDGGGAPPLAEKDGHCPFCRLASASAVPFSPGVLSFPPPEPATFFVPATDARFQPSAPDSRHAPKHAPPFPFA
ncbi:MAG: DUF2946 family protein [Azoarcus sp.]|jgi:hypothetical protein|nr:DUF2946 family protein [Azoarcus sp.]